LLSCPIRDLNFPWGLLGWAGLHHRLVTERNRARRERLILDDAAHQDTPIQIAQRGRIESLIAAIRGNAHAQAAQREQMSRNVEATLAR